MKGKRTKRSPEEQAAYDARTRWIEEILARMDERAREEREGRTAPRRRLIPIRWVGWR